MIAAAERLVLANAKTQFVIIHRAKRPRCTLDGREIDDRNPAAASVAATSIVSPP